MFGECKQDAVYQIPHSKLALCKEHFIANVQKRVKTLIEHKHMFHPDAGEKVLIAASGGKDSQVLIDILKSLYPSGTTFEGIYIQLGIHSDNYSSDSQIIAQNFCNSLHIPIHVIHIENEYQFTVDSIEDLKKNFHRFGWDGESDQFRGPCAYCGAIKRYSINYFASKGKYDAVLTGHNLTDEGTALINNFLNMEFKYLSRTGPFNDSKMDGLVPRGKPLFYISEEEIMMYAYLNNIPHNPTECPYSVQSPNTKLKEILNGIERKRAGSTLSMIRQFHKKLEIPIRNSYTAEKNKDEYCSICGTPTIKNTCSFCRLRKGLNSRFERVKLENERKNNV